MRSAPHCSIRGSPATSGCSTRSCAAATGPTTALTRTDSVRGRASVASRTRGSARTTEQPDLGIEFVEPDAGLFSQRVRAAARRAAAGKRGPLLALPTHTGGWIAPAALVARLTEVGEDVDEPELLQALLRLAPDGRAAALAAAADLRRPARALGPLRARRGGSARRRAGRRRRTRRPRAAARSHPGGSGERGGRARRRGVLLRRVERTRRRSPRSMRRRRRAGSTTRRADPVARAPRPRLRRRDRPGRVGLPLVAVRRRRAAAARIAPERPRATDAARAATARRRAVRERRSRPPARRGRHHRRHRGWPARRHRTRRPVATRTFPAACC